MSSGKVLLGLVAGAAAGALLGILFAPEKGSVTRKKISDKGSDYADSIKEKFSDIIDDISDKYDGAREDVSDFAKKGKDKKENAKNPKEATKA